jgi:hypothetical protein
MADRTTTILENSIREAIDNYMKDVHTWLPAIVTKVNKADQLVDCQIALKRKLGGKLVLLPTIPNVPIRYWKTRFFAITIPPEVDDYVMLHFCERSLDVWMQEGGIRDPFDIRKFELSDAVAYPMLYPQTEKIENFNENDLELKTLTDNTKITIKKSEGIDIFTTGNVVVTCANVNVNCNVLTVSSSTSNINAISGVNVTTPLTQVNGNLTVTGTITGETIDATSSLTVATKEMSGHTHAQGPDSNGDTEQNTGPPL